MQEECRYVYIAGERYTKRNKWFTLTNLGGGTDQSRQSSVLMAGVMFHVRLCVTILLDNFCSLIDFTLTLYGDLNMTDCIKLPSTKLVLNEPTSFTNLDRTTAARNTINGLLFFFQMN